MILRRLKQNVLSSPTITTWLNLSAKSMAVFALIPLVNTNFSELDRFVWFTLSSMWSFVLLLDLGLNPTITRYFSYLKTSNNLSHIIAADDPLSFRDARHLTIMVSRIYGCIALAVILIVLPLIFFSVYEKIGNSGRFYEIAGLILISTGISIFYLSSNVFTGIVQGLGHLPKAQFSQFLVAIVSVVASSVIIYQTENIVWTVIGFYIPYFFYYFIIRKIALSLIAKTFDSGIVSHFLEIKDVLSKRLLRDTAKSGVGILASQGLILGSTILVNRLESIEVATTYMMCLQFIRAISSYSQVPFYSQIPTFCQHYAEKKYSLLSFSLDKRFSFSIMLYLALTIVVGLAAQTNFFVSYLGAGFETKLWQLFGLTFLFERIGSTLMQAYTVTGDIKWHLANSGSAVLSVSILFLYHNSIDVSTILSSIMVSYLLFVIPYSLFLIWQDQNLEIKKMKGVPIIMTISLAIWYSFYEII